MQRYHESPSTLHVGTLENRAYYIPFSNRESALRGDITQSDRYVLLNGNWAFAFYPSFEEVPEKITFTKTIPVPGMWQNNGYDKHQYTNVKFPIPYDPPYVPQKNPCGVYECTFEAAQVDEYQFALNFEGVDSCYYVWLNGNFVGFSQVSHSTSEFNITPFLREGKNTLRVLVLKWCFGTYLEDQDKLRMTGIFRDVYILKRDKNHLRDFFVHTFLQEENKKASVEVAFEYEGALKEAQITLLDPQGAKFLSKTAGDKVAFEVENPALWTAETPKLYTLVIEAGNEVIVQKVGIREITAPDGVLKINGQPIKFRGVNRHDSDPVTGYVISKEQMLTDMRLMKEHNINAIRTSHYPNAPWMVQLCNELGFYVIDEADVEAHGVTSLYESREWSSLTKGDFNRIYGRIARDPMFEEGILDRNQRAVIRDKNNPCVIMWSMGNEAGYGPSFEKAGRWIKQYDPTRLVHYEGSYHLDPSLDNDVSMIDVFSRMYPSVEEFENYLKEGSDNRPYVLCEYIHAMGNGPGDAQDYQEIFDKYPRACGGFVWEFCDHAVYMGKTVNGKEKYFYGGDFGEYPHDGNFCTDGLIYPDRRPHTGFKEVKNVYRPVRAQWADQEKGIVTFSNWMDFLSTDDYVEAYYLLSHNGNKIKQEKIDLPNIAPHEKAQVTLPVEASGEGKWLLDIVYLQKNDEALTPKGHELGTDQLTVKEGRALPQVNLPEGKRGVTTTERALEIDVIGENFRYTFDKSTGLFAKLSYGQNSYLTRPMEYNIWRAPTDNDRNIRHTWAAAGYDKVQPRVYETRVEQVDGKVIIKAKLSLAAVVLQRVMTIDAAFAIDQKGQIDIALHCEKDPAMPFLPRFGLRLFMPWQMGKVEYFGYGPYESYVDKQRASVLGKYTTTPWENHEDYIKPQENGSHYGCDYVTAQGDTGGIAVISETPFSFNLSPYTQEELTHKAHNFELEPCGDAVLCIDYKVSGIGSNSCGPKLLEKYQFAENTFTFNVTLSPYIK